MSVDIKVPSLGESVVEATVAKWYKNEGDSVTLDEPLLELETDKVTLEVPSPTSGLIDKISSPEGSTVEVGALLGVINDTADVKKAPKNSEKIVTTKEEKPKEEPAMEKPVLQELSVPLDNTSKEILESKVSKLSPAVRKIAAEKNIDISQVATARSDGRITKGDILASNNNVQELSTKPPISKDHDSKEERVPMSRLRQTIAKRLKDAQNNAAMLTTFNEVDMGELIRTRNEHKDAFESKYGIKLGFMSFFVKACITALKDIPEVNAEVENNDVIYKNFYNIGVAVGTDQGLVVPVIRDADQKSIVEIEQEIFNLGQKARTGKLSIDDMQGGTFTVSNGGVYGSLMSTPILNPPQSGILGLHNIVKRPVVVENEIVIRPVMYIALTYDHRIIDGKQAVTFLVRLKQIIENPEEMIFEK